VPREGAPRCRRDVAERAVVRAHGEPPARGDAARRFAGAAVAARRRLRGRRVPLDRERLARVDDARHAVSPAEGHDDGRVDVRAGEAREPPALPGDGQGVPVFSGGTTVARASLNAAIKRRLGATLWSVSDVFRRLELGLKLVVWSLIRLVYKETVEALR